jgi:lysophospholipase L1-like esterase
VKRAAAGRALRGPLWKKLALLCGSTLLALAAAELGLRLYYAYRRHAAAVYLSDDEGRRHVVESDVPGLIYTYAPYVEGANSEGYLDDEHVLQKPAGCFRVVVIGDSVAEGQGVPHEASFPKVLQRRLNAATTSPRFEVVVLARSGYGTAQELILLESEAFRYAPDLVLWSYVLNDPAHPLYHDVSGNMRLLYRPTCYLLHLGRAAWFSLEEAARSRGGPREFHARLHRVYREQIVAAFERIGRQCRKHRTPAVLAVHPVFEEQPDFAAYSLRGVHEDLVQMARDAGLLPFDLLEAYTGHAPEELQQPGHPWHPNETGHRLAGEFLARRLAENELVPRDPRRSGASRGGQFGAVAADGEVSPLMSAAPR